MDGSAEHDDVAAVTRETDAPLREIARGAEALAHDALDGDALVADDARSDTDGGARNDARSGAGDDAGGDSRNGASGGE